MIVRLMRMLGCGKARNVGASLALSCVIASGAGLVAVSAQAAGCPEACAEHGICRKGRCWCEKGWVGEDCSREGDNPCDMGCYGHGSCNPKTLLCKCEDGWAGPFCGKARKRTGAAAAASDEKGKARQRGGKGPRRGARDAQAGPPCPDELSRLPWWERYKVASSLNEEEVRQRLRNCENRPEPGACVDALVKLGEVRPPALAACEYRPSAPDGGE